MRVNASLTTPNQNGVDIIAVGSRASRAWQSFGAQFGVSIVASLIFGFSVHSRLNANPSARQFPLFKFYSLSFHKKT